MTHHLGYDKHQLRLATNARNGYTQKTVIIGDGLLELRTPRDRDGSFEPKLVKKNQLLGMRNILRFVSWRDYKVITHQLI